MTDRRIAQTTPAPNAPLDDLAAKIEQELERLRAKRPHLSKRIDRAGDILVQHLSCPRQRPIRVRVRQGRLRFLVDGSGGSVYSVDPEAWSCSCPDFHRRDAICKHGIAVYVLVRAARSAPKDLRCAACGERFPRRVMVEVQESLTYETGSLMCTPCWLGSDAEAL